MSAEQKDQLERYPKDAYVPRITVHRHTPKGAIKPNPEILRKILSEVGGSIEATAYVGDSELKDIAMAQAVGVADVWAKLEVVQEEVDIQLAHSV
jgi:phosphoglycolate phosphatase